MWPVFVICFCVLFLGCRLLRDACCLLLFEVYCVSLLVVGLLMVVGCCSSLFVLLCLFVVACCHLFVVGRCCFSLMSRLLLSVVH